MSVRTVFALLQKPYHLPFLIGISLADLSLQYKGHKNFAAVISDRTNKRAIMIPYNQVFITLNQWEKLSKDSLSSISEQNGVMFENKVETENTDQKIITLTKRLTLFEQIGAFFQLVAQQLFSRNPHIRAILPKAWDALIAGEYVQSYIYEKAAIPTSTLKDGVLSSQKSFVNNFSEGQISNLDGDHQNLNQKATNDPFISNSPSTSCNSEGIAGDLLPNEILALTTTYLDPSDLATLSQTSKQFTEKIVKDGWKSVADRIQCPLNVELPYKPQVQAFIHELKQKAEALPNWPYAAPLIKSNKFGDLCNLQKLIKARDTAVVWKALEELIQELDDAPNLDTFNKVEDLLQIPKQFTVWCNTHQITLTQLTYLPIVHKPLTSLPSEIGSLTQLKKLYLRENPLGFPT